MKSFVEVLKEQILGIMKLDGIFTFKPNEGSPGQKLVVLLSVDVLVHDAGYVGLWHHVRREAHQVVVQCGVRLVQLLLDDGLGRLDRKQGGHRDTRAPNKKTILREWYSKKKTQGKK